MRPALSLRAAVGSVRSRTRVRPVDPGAIVADYVRRYGGVPATSHPRSEPVVLYRAASPAGRVLLGAYGDPDTVRGWLPGLPRTVTPASAAAMVAGARAPVTVADPVCRQLVGKADLTALPIPVATPRDAGPYLTMGLVHAADPVTGEQALSVHRMLVLDTGRLTVWMVPGRQLRAMHAAAIGRGEVLPVSVNLGAPPAAVVASAVQSRFLPPGVSKLDVAGALAGAPVRLAPGLTQPVPVLADSEIVLEGFLGAETADETRSGTLGRSMPEFLGYDGNAQAGLPVLTLTGQSSRRDPMLQAVAGPGREQSVVLGLAGALSVALSLDTAAVTALDLSPAGGGMLLLVAAVTPGADLGHLADRIFRQHAFVKLVVFVDADIDPARAEDVLWAIVTRANLSADCHALPGFAPLGMDPSQRPEWALARGQEHPPARTFIDATTPPGLAASTARSFG